MKDYRVRKREREEAEMNGRMKEVENERTE